MIKCFNCFGDYDDSFDVCPHCGYVKGSITKDVNQLPTGTVLNGQYVIGTVVASGGFGIIYRAWDMTLDTLVAVKEHYPAGLVNRIPGETKLILTSSKRSAAYKHEQQRFLAEAKNTAKFAKYVNILNVFNYFEENNTSYFVMEFLVGESLSDFMKRQPDRKVELSKAIEVTASICKAFQIVHTGGIVHRDVSPDNIFLCENGVVKLIDFGACCKIGQVDPEDEVILKPSFSPPEQYNKKNSPGAWMDIYALGASLYYMLTGIKPDESTNRIIEDKLVPPNQIDPSIPENISNAVMRAMALDKSLRFSSADEFAKAITGDKKVDTPEIARKKRRTRRLISGIAAIVVLLGAGGVVAKLAMDAKNETDLKPADITIWHCQSDGSTESAAFESIVADFTESFNKVNIHIESIPEDEYEDRLIEALASGNGPHLFESTGIDTERISEYTIDLSGLSDSAQAEECYFVGDMDISEKLPLAMNVPVAYIITNGPVCVDYTDAYFSSLSDFGATKIAIDENARDMWEELLGEEAIADCVSADEFYENDSAEVILSSTYELSYMQEKLQRYTTDWAFFSEPSCELTYEWSIANGSEAENAAAERLLQWMMGQQYQSLLMSKQCQDGQLPINMAEFTSRCTDLKFTALAADGAELKVID